MVLVYRRDPSFCSIERDVVKHHLATKFGYTSDIILSIAFREIKILGYLCSYSLQLRYQVHKLIYPILLQFRIIFDRYYYQYKSDKEFSYTKV